MQSRSDRDPEDTDTLLKDRFCLDHWQIKRTGHRAHCRSPAEASERILKRVRQHFDAVAVDECLNILIIFVASECDHNEAYEQKTLESRGLFDEVSADLLESGGAFSW